MEPFTVHTGIVAPLDLVDVDTDQIIPAVFLKHIERTGFGQFLFHTWRFLPDGRPNPDFALNQPKYRGATILVAGRNFGIGSSREHAPWALLDYGFRAIIAPSFGDIFSNNCFQNGILPVTLLEEQVRELIEKASLLPSYRVTVDLEQCEVRGQGGFSGSFEVNEFRRHCLIHGLDHIALTLQHEGQIRAFEQRRMAQER